MKSKSITVKIQCDNDAFEGCTTFEVGRILHGLADSLTGCSMSPLEHWADHVLRDINGNKVGSVKLTGF